MVSYVSPEERVPQRHPSCPIREMVDRALAALGNPRTWRPDLPHIAYATSHIPARLA
jgi:hypothetical protein